LGSGRWDAEASLAEVERPLFVLSMAGDRFAPQAAAHELAAKTRGEVRTAQLVALPSGRAPGHFHWMREPEPVVEHLRRWLAELPPE
jgi:predicted alpha/beta hydrolase